MFRLAHPPRQPGGTAWAAGPGACRRSCRRAHQAACQVPHDGIPVGFLWICAAPAGLLRQNKKPRLVTEAWIHVSMCQSIPLYELLLRVILNFFFFFLDDLPLRKARWQDAYLVLRVWSLRRLGHHGISGQHLRGGHLDRVCCRRCCFQYSDHSVADSCSSG